MNNCYFQSGALNVFFFPYSSSLKSVTRDNLISRLDAKRQSSAD